jgi:hypothetical protein
VPIACPGFRALCSTILGLVFCAQLPAQPTAPFRLVRSLSGPSGRVLENKFVLDEVRNHFKYPEDKQFVVYFEWEGPSGEHILTGQWRAPDGRINSISPDVRLKSTETVFGAYWTYEISHGVPSGIWSLEVRINGASAGSHSFEMIIPAVPEEASPTPSSLPSVPTPDEVYRETRNSLVWIHKIDESGRRIDLGSGFVIAPNQVATAFQIIDAATTVEVEFETGRRVVCDELWSWNRLQDWAVLKADTAGAPALRAGEPSKLAVAERLLVFNVEGDKVRAFGGIDLSGRRIEPGFVCC